MTDLHHRPATALVALLASGEVSSVELLDHFLARVERDGPAINAVVALDAERARARAAEADAARAPAHYCGVFGLKPTWGIVPIRGHIPGPPGSLAVADVGVAGPLGRSAADLVLGLDVLAGPAGDDAVAWRLELPPPRNGGAVEGLRVATWFDAPAPAVAADVRAALDRAAGALSDAGAVVTAVPAPVPLDELLASWERLVLPIATAGLPDDVFAGFAEAADAPATDDEPAAMRGVRAIALRHRDWLRADERRQHHRRRFAELFERVDVLLAPVMPTAAPLHGDAHDITARRVDVDGELRPALEGIDWNGGIGTLLLPVAVPPIGRTPSGLPVGVQVVAPHLHDRTAVAVAAILERLLGGFVAPPALDDS